MIKCGVYGDIANLAIIKKLENYWYYWEIGGITTYGPGHVPHHFPDLCFHGLHSNSK